MNQTYFKSVNSGQFLEIPDSPDKQHLSFGLNVLSSTGNENYIHSKNRQKLYEITFVMSIFKMVFFKIHYPMHVESVFAKYSARKS